MRISEAKLLPGDCIMVKGNSFFSKAILLLTSWHTKKALLSHVACYIGNGYWWKVATYPRIGKITKRDAKMLQQHRYAVIGGIMKGGVRVLTAVGYEDDEAKKIFLGGTTKRLEADGLLDKNTQKKLGFSNK